MAVMGWSVAVGCANHDAQTALKWSVSHIWQWVCFRKLFISIAACRNGFNHLHRKVGAFVAQHLYLSDKAFNRSQVESFLGKLGVDNEVAQFMANINLEWHDGGLWVHESAGPITGKLIEQVALCLVSLMSFPKFSDSRWVTLGMSCRALTASLAFGLERLLEFTRKDPSVSDYYLHGFDQLDDESVLYAMVAAISSPGADAMLCNILADDRLGLSCGELEQTIREQQAALEGVEAYTWSRLAPLVGGLCPNELQDKCLHAFHVVQGYVQKKVFHAAKSYPWKLLHGDRAANLDELRTVAGIQDETTLKIQQLVKSGYNQELLLEGLERLADAKWTTTGVEQGHGSMTM